MTTCVKCGCDVPDKTGFGVCFLYGVFAPPELTQGEPYAVICDSCGAGKSGEEILSMIPVKVTQEAIRNREIQKAFCE